MKILICSTLSAVPWGGSEELWSRAAAVLLRAGHEIYISFPYQSELPSQLNTLRDLGAHLIPSHQPNVGSKLTGRWSFRRPARSKQPAQIPLHECLHNVKPDLALISMSWHLDDLSMTWVCRDAGVPYSLLVQAAGSNVFLDGEYWPYFQTAFSGAAKCFFVSEQNRDVVEANLGIDLSQSLLVDNPFSVKVDATIPWPESEDPWRLACVGRLHFQSKAQDLLLQTLRRPQWRDRNLEVTLFGADCGNGGQAKALIKLYGLQNQVKLGGFVNDITQVWRTHHGLVLPSRYEGNSLAMIEAMLCGRTPIVTDVGRVASLVDDNVSGFVAPAATVPLLEATLERAWRRRHKWKRMGAVAAAAIRKRHSLRPAEDFAELVLRTIPRRVNAFRAA